MLRRAAATTTRSFSTTAVARAFQKKAGQTSGARDQVFKRGTPHSSKGWIYNFKETSAYSRLGKEAPKAEDVDFFALDNLIPGAVMRYPTDTLSSLGALGSFKRGQRHEIFKDKTTLIRDSTTLPVSQLIQNGTKSESKANRMCLLGDSGVGKSTLLAQSHALALLNGYIVLHVPRPRELINGDNDAVFHEKSQLFTQPMYTRQWLKRIAKSNKDQLSKLEFSGTKKAGVNSILDYILYHKNDKDIHGVLENVLSELSNSASPVLFTFDDINIFNEYTHSENVDTNNRHIYHGRLHVPRVFLDYLSGARSFKAGAVIAATTGANKLNETIPAGLELAQPTPYSKITRFDPKLAQCFKGVQPLTVSRYSQEETKASIDYWHSVKVIPSNEITQSFVDSKYFVSGNGNPRSLLAACTQLY